MKPIRTALASYGMSGALSHGPFLSAHPEYEVVTVCERFRERSRSRFPKATIVRSFDEIIDDASVELVVVNTPDPLHGEMCRHALEAGKHVVVEKPFVKSSVEARELVSLANRNERTIAEYYNRRYDGDFQRLRSLVSERSLGTICELESRIEFWRPVEPDVWRESEFATAGALFNIGSHLLDQVLLLFGRPQTLLLTQHRTRPGSRIYDFFRLELSYEGSVVMLQSSYAAREPYPRFRVRGTDATWVKFGHDGQQAQLAGEEPDSEYSLLVRGNGADKMTERQEVSPGNYALFYDRLYAQVREGASSAANGLEAILNTELLELAEQSFRTGRRITLNSS